MYLITASFVSMRKCCCDTRQTGKHEADYCWCRAKRKDKCLKSRSLQREVWWWSLGLAKHVLEQCLKFVVEISSVTRLCLDFNMFYCDNRYSQLIVVKMCTYFTKHVHMSKHRGNIKSHTGGVKIHLHCWDHFVHYESSCYCIVNYILQHFLNLEVRSQFVQGPEEGIFHK